MSLEHLVRRLNYGVLSSKTAHRQFGQRQFSQFEIQTIQPEIYRQFRLRQFSQFYKTLDSKEKNRNWSYFSVLSFVKSPTLCWQARNTLARLRRSLLLAELSLAELSAYFWLNCLNFKSAELFLVELSGRVPKHPRKQSKKFETLDLKVFVGKIKI